MQRYANVILPIGPFTETSGTFVNAEGRWQSFAGVVSPLGESRPGWKVLRVLGNLFGLDGFDYFSSEEVRDELRAMTTDIKADNTIVWSCPSKLGVEAVSGTMEIPMYAVDAIVRRATSLQKTADGQAAANYFNEIEVIKARLGLQGTESTASSGKVAAHV
jgi:NADH-quinone oxidoreductase subunit G